MTTPLQEHERCRQEIDLLFRIGQTLNQSTDVREVVDPVLRVLARSWGMLRGTLTILNRHSREIFIEVAYGLSSEELRRGRYQLGEGVTGKVVASGEPIIVPRITDEPKFLNRTRARERMDHQNISFICVPVKFGSEVIGALSIDKEFQKGRAFDEDVRILSIIASMIARSVQIHQSIHEEQLLQEENERLQNELKDKFRPANMVAHSKSMQEVFDMIERVTRTDTTVFIAGESGVGKELVAAAIHYNSPRADKPFIKLNCAALPENLIESELFGHEKGAFTGAFAAQKGRFELAHEGTIFLDEIGDLSPSTQVKLLRVLQEKEIERLGAGRSVKVDVRVIAATNKNLETMVEQGSFRQDLYYRLNVFPLRIPPLRERKTDIMPLADHFVEKYSRKMGFRIKRITTAAIDMIMAYHWPGNVRELENAMERAVLLSTDDVIHSYHLPPSLQTAESSGTGIQGTLNLILNNVERDIIIDALKSSRGNAARAAQMLGITERILGLRIKKYQIDPRRFK